MTEPDTATRRAFLGAATAVCAGAAGAGVANGAEPSGTDTQLEQQSCSSGDVGAQHAIRARERAERLRNELRSLADQYPALVDVSVLQSVDNQVTNGASEFEIGNYCEATAAFEQASEQAAGALREYYSAAVADRLDSVEQLISTAQAEAAIDTDAVRLQDRRERVQSNAKDATTLRDWRRVHDQAVTLHRDTEAQLTPTWSERFLAEAGVVFPTLSAVLAGIVGVETYWLRQGGHTSTEEVDDTDPYPTADDD